MKKNMIGYLKWLFTRKLNFACNRDASESAPPLALSSISLKLRMKEGLLETMITPSSFCSYMALLSNYKKKETGSALTPTPSIYIIIRQRSHIGKAISVDWRGQWRGCERCKRGRAKWRTTITFVTVTFIIALIYFWQHILKTFVSKKTQFNSWNIFLPFF